jgi:ADP-ribosylglycohydrolase
MKRTDFPLVDDRAHFTDDTVLTLATAQSLLSGTSYGGEYKRLGRRYPGAGYGGSFIRWLQSESLEPYNSFGNGSAMRVSPIGWAFDGEEEVLEQARASALCTHDHPEGVKGAQAVALSIFLGRAGSPKWEIAEEVGRRFGYDLSRSVDEIRPRYRFDVTCQGSVPEAIRCALEAESAEGAIRLAVSLGGDADTQACIAGAIGDALYGPVSEKVASHVRGRLSDELLQIHDEFIFRR